MKIKELKTYRRNFKKIVWGHMEVEAESPEHAQERWDNGLEDEFENKSDYEFEEWESDEDLEEPDKESEGEHLYQEESLK